MKNIVAVCLLFVSAASFSQSASLCGSVPPASFLESYADKNRDNTEAVLHSRAGIQWVPVYYHIITQTDGSGGASLKDVFDSHCELNTVFNTFDLGFFVAGIDTIKSTTLWEYQDDNLYSGAFSTYNKSNVCNVYVNGNLPGLCGFATFPQTGRRGGGIFLNKSCVGANTATYPHEMGHYLGLLHTFDSYFGKEFVNGSNCASTGDRFCDTPADFIDYRTPCPYTGDAKDPRGDLYRTVLDESLYMSYFYDGCVDKFSNMQKAEMVSVINNERSNLLTGNVPDVQPLGLVNMITPVNGDNSVNSASTSFIWNAVPKTDFYYFYLQSATSSAVIAEVITTDTSFITSGLQPSKKYKYIVKALSFGNTCGTEPVYQTFTTSSLKVDFSINPPQCSNETNGDIFVVATGGTSPYTYEWFDGSTESVLAGVPEGYYAVTVTDSKGKQAVSSAYVDAPDPVSVKFNMAGTNITAIASGGTGPYSYSWSNGVSTQTNNTAKYGASQDITVTDGMGCSVAQSVIVSSINEAEESKTALRVFPNPAGPAAVVNVQLELDAKETATISLVNINGEIVQQFNRGFLPGINNVQLNTAQLPAGIYIIRYQGTETVGAERLSVFR